MTKMVYTLDNIHTVQDIISDLAKDIYGTRAACPRTPETQVAFMNSYDELFQDSLDADAEELAHYGRLDGRTYTSWMEYYDAKEAEMEAAQLPEVIEELPFQPSDHKMVSAIENWAHGG